jgi:predicted ester cyclase
LARRRREQWREALRGGLERAYNRGDLAALDGLYAPEVTYHRPPLPDIEGREALKGYVVDLRRTFSSLRFTIDEIILEKEGLAARWTLRGTHTGRSPSMLVPPTGKEATLTGCTTAHRTRDRIIEQWDYGDWLGLFHRLGVIPPLA